MKEMSDAEKVKLICQIISELRSQAQLHNKPFDGGEMFFSLVFKSDDELKKIARLTGI